MHDYNEHQSIDSNKAETEQGGSDIFDAFCVIALLLIVVVGISYWLYGL